MIQLPSDGPSEPLQPLTSMKRYFCLAVAALGVGGGVLAQDKQDASVQPKLSGSNQTSSPDNLKILDKEIGISGDYLRGQGNVVLPVGYGIARANPLQPVGNGEFTRASRNGDYFGGTLSGSLGKTWYLDVSYSRGVSQGALTSLSALVQNTDYLSQSVSSYKLSEESYAAYLKYTFPQLSGTRFSAYLRLGGTYAPSQMSAADGVANVRYAYDATYTDYLGNLGAGIDYSVYRGDRLRATVLFEAEGFGGIRQGSGREEMLVSGRLGTSSYSGSLANESIVYGGIGRLVSRFEYTLDRDGRWRLNIDAGFQAHYLLIDYASMPDGVGDRGPGAVRTNVRGDELLWGPYARIGLSFSF